MIAVTGQAASMMAVLHRARMVLLSVALMVGILGMHVMSLAPMDGHGTPAEASAAVHSAAMPDHNHGGQQQPGTAPDDHCTGPHGGTGMHTMDSSCTPAAASASFAAPPPGTGVAVATPPFGVFVASPRWSYRPGSPSPGDLCISRT
ncbi:DUF6153 family protein [Arthrobacter sp. YD4]|uniref:DUF6153 family protein n=1 Tax=Arthrobacter sp. YD4 TaxID=3058043 RepID=UPI0025B42FB0|nr:DUF6153 family protein [Arthrobacter sp. YD4]MDN3935840.1 DUF6153 family protein [Arthrobacter sp. YD4]